MTVTWSIKCIINSDHNIAQDIWRRTSCILLQRAHSCIQNSDISYVTDSLTYVTDWLYVTDWRDCVIGNICNKPLFYLHQQQANNKRKRWPQTNDHCQANNQTSQTLELSCKLIVMSQTNHKVNAEHVWNDYFKRTANAVTLVFQLSANPII